MVLTTLAIGLGAWGYFRAGSPLWRVAALMAGLFLATLLDIINRAVAQQVLEIARSDGSGE